MKGKLKHWNEDRGFGFISTDEVPQDIFIHISALKRMSRRPIVGDIIIFQIHTENDGKKRATSAQIQGVASVVLKKEKLNSNWLFFLKIASLALVVAIIFGIFNSYLNRSRSSIISNKPITLIKSSKTKRNNYSCQGKVYCSEMSSCNEAKFYLDKCPDTKIDGDNDGVPCERQWCY